MSESEIRQRGGASRDLNAARAAFDTGDVDASRQAHEANKIHSTEQHAGCVVFRPSSLASSRIATARPYFPLPSPRLARRDYHRHAKTSRCPRD
jgi:hypothetical protein